MRRVPIKQAKDQFPALVREAEAGARIDVTRNGKAVADLVPHEESRGIDWESGRKWLAERGIENFFGKPSGDFDDPLPEDFLLRPLP